MSHKPNVVVLTDPLCSQALGTYGSEVVLTPHIGRLTHEGVCLEHGFTNNPGCVLCDRETTELSMVLGYAGRFIYSTAPDYHLMRGSYRFQYAIAPHGAYDPAWNNRRAKESTNPMLVMKSYRWRATPEGGPRGRLPQKGSLVEVNAPSGIVSTIALGKGQPIIRLYEDAGQTSTANIRFAWPISAAQIVDLSGNTLETLQVRRNAVRVELEPFRIITVQISLQDDVSQAL
jgi:alpha-mannosidase